MTHILRVDSDTNELSKLLEATFNGTIYVFFFFFSINGIEVWREDDAKLWNERWSVDERICY